MNIKLFKKADLIVIALILAAAGLFIYLAGRDTSEPVAEISVDGEIIQTVDLFSVNERTEIRPDGDYNIIIVAENGKIRFEHSDCEDKLCVASGNLEKSGDIAVCLPAKTVITVTGTELDAVVY